MLLTESLYSSKAGIFNVGLRIICELALLCYSAFRKRFHRIQQLLNYLKVYLKVFNVRNILICHLKCKLVIGRNLNNRIVAIVIHYILINNLKVFDIF